MREQSLNCTWKLILQTDILSTSREIDLRWVSQNPIDMNSTWVEVKAWCRYTNERAITCAYVYSVICRHMVTLDNDTTS